PTLVLHSKNDWMVPLERGRQIAAYIPDARFVAFDGRNLILQSTEPEASRFWSEFYRFLGIDAESFVLPKKTATSSGEKILLELSARKRDVLRLVAEGYDNMEIARKLSLSEKTVRNYVSIIYAKLQVSSRGEAIVMARKSGLVDDKFQ
ncbi:MAG TPA: response regulator transcription factor, partial [Anaerolineales bacterium]|nr:response regulator transcription factor [Anaerolineales bacterium]